MTVAATTAAICLLCLFVLLPIVAWWNYVVVRRVHENVTLRDRILQGDDPNMVMLHFGPDLRLLDTRGFPTEMVGLGYGENGEVRKMRDRALTGGGFVPFTLRVGRALHRYVLMCRSHGQDGSIICEGLRQN